MGCATGEEVYSLAILLLEQAKQESNVPMIQIFASDLHEHSLQRARQGFYPDNIEDHVSAERLKIFFSKEEGGYRIHKNVREIVVFANHNLLSDPPFSHMDLFVCRNLLIYLQHECQGEVLDLFHYALNPDGILVLGPSENVGRTGLFRVENKRHSIYRRRNVPVPEQRLPVFFHPFRRMEQNRFIPHQKSFESPVSYGTMHHQVVERYALPSILINEESQVAHVSEHAGCYLQVAGGEPTTNVYKLLREELRLELRSALRKAAETVKNIRTTQVPTSIEGAPVWIVMHVRPAQTKDLDGHYLVIFDEMEETELPLKAIEVNHNSTTELEAMRKGLRKEIKQYESAQEAMQVTNEELQLSNEELRSPWRSWRPARKSCSR